MKKLLENKIVLYIVFFLSLSTIFGYMVLNNYAAVLFFILMAFLTNYFSKNMIVILGCAILGTHLLAMLDVFNNVREGFKEGANGDDDATGAGTSDATTEPELTVEEPESNVSSSSTTLRSTTVGSAAKHNCQSPFVWNEKKQLCCDISDNCVNEEGFANKKKKKKTGFNNMNPLNPADIMPNVDSILTRDDKAKAKERAYDIVEEKLGKDKLQNMNIDTKELIDRQKELMEEMKKITPILSQTMGMMGNMDLSSLTSMFDKITDMMPSK